MSPLVSGFFRSWVTLTLSAPLLMSHYFLPSSFFCFSTAVVAVLSPPSSVSLPNHLSLTCAGVVMAITLAWLGLSKHSDCCSLCGHSPAANPFSIYNLYSGIHTHTHTHTLLFCYM
ncbi:hypothetical protein AMECASPLE_039751 [Ameca splendens]|uniref:Uncharacterized protein n=1 Tax=Ameca splendens TaxID=208324 RepID=A0ABV0XXK8_9TELE